VIILGKIPHNWFFSSPNSTNSHLLIRLDPFSPEYRTIADNMAQSCDYFKILYLLCLFSSVNDETFQIERVENPLFYQRYQMSKQQLQLKLSSTKVETEMRLFHGTVEENITAICVAGFNRSLAGTNGIKFLVFFSLGFHISFLGTVYGSGSYFAKDFAYSYRYGKKIFQCRVLTGRFCQGSAEMKVAPWLDKGQGVLYDSVVNSVVNPEIFVVFSDNHAYPEYLITVE